MRIKKRAGKFQGDAQLCLTSSMAVALVRGSTSEQLNTLATQQLTAHQYAERMHFELLDCIIDSGTSASKIRFFDRPKAQEALALMQMRNCFQLLVTKTDRAFRNHEDAMVTCRILWEDYGISVHFMDDGLISTREKDKLVLQIRASVDEEESRKRRERQMETLDTMRRENQRCGQYAPYGWRFDPTRERTTRRGTTSDYLIPDGEEQFGLARMFALIESGLGTSKVARLLNAEGIQPKGKPCWQRKAAARVIGYPLSVNGSESGTSTNNEEPITNNHQIPSRGIWYASTVQSVLEHGTLADGTYCQVENRSGRLVFTFQRSQIRGQTTAIAA